MIRTFLLVAAAATIAGCASHNYHTHDDVYDETYIETIYVVKPKSAQTVYRYYTPNRKVVRNYKHTWVNGRHYHGYKTHIHPHRGNHKHKPRIIKHYKGRKW